MSQAKPCGVLFYSNMIVMVVMCVSMATSSWVGIRRNATMELLTYIRSLTAVQGKVAPISDDPEDWRVQARVNLVVQGVTEVNDALQTITVAVLLMVTWSDPALTWNSSLYQGLTTLEMAITDVWVPRIKSSSSLGNQDLTSTVSKVELFSNGWMRMTAYLNGLQNMCYMDLRHFPYDQYTCTLSVQAASSFVQVHLSARAMEATFSENSPTYPLAWDMLAVSASLTHMTAGTFTQYTPVCQISIKRRTAFYTACLVLPMTLTSYMNTLVFLLPLESGEKVSYLVTLSVSTSVFISFFSDVMPRGLEAMPAILKLLVGVMVQSVLVLIATILVQRRHHHQPSAQRPRDSAQEVDGRTDDNLLKQPDTSLPGSLGQHDKFVTEGLGKPAPKDSRRKRTIFARLGGGQVDVLHSGAEGDRLTLKKGRGWIQMSAVTLDHAFFVLFFAGNSIFLACLLGDELGR